MPLQCCDDFGQCVTQQDWIGHDHGQVSPMFTRPTDVIRAMTARRPLPLRAMRAMCGHAARIAADICSEVMLPRVRAK